MDSKKRKCDLCSYAKTLIKIKARQLARRAGLNRSNVEDLEADLTADLLSRLPQFDPNKAKICTFIARIVERRISRILRDRVRECRDFRRETCSINEMVVDPEGFETEQAAVISQDEVDIRWGKRDRTREEQGQLRLDVTFVIPKLPQDLREVVIDLLKTGSITETAKNLGVPRTTLYGAIRHLRVVFESAGLKDYL